MKPVDEINQFIADSTPDAVVLRHTALSVDAGDSSADPDDYTVTPLHDGIAIIADTYVEGGELFYDAVATHGKVWRRLPFKHLMTHLNQDYLCVHAAYVLRLHAVVCTDKWVKRRLDRLVKREVVRLTKVTDLEQTLIAQYEQEGVFHAS